MGKRLRERIDCSKCGITTSCFKDLPKEDKEEFVCVSCKRGYRYSYEVLKLRKDIIFIENITIRKYPNRASPILSIPPNISNGKYDIILIPK